MDKTRVAISIAGQELKVAGGDSEKYIKQLANFVNAKIEEIQKEYPSMGNGTCILLAMLNMADELQKLRLDYDALDQRISQLMDMPKNTGVSTGVPVKRPFETKQTVGVK